MRTIGVSIGAAFLLASLLTLSGCGGGTGSAGDGTLHLYVTDAPADYAGVWTTVYRVEVAQATGPYRTVFDSSDGTELNLPDLADAADYLGSATLPAGVYTRARVTLRNTMRIMQATGSVQDVPLHAGAGTGFTMGPGEQCQAEFPIQITVPTGGAAEFAVDFDLPSFQMMGNALHAQIRAADHTQLQARMRRARLVGVVTNLNPGVEFDLRLRTGNSIHIALTSSTVVVSAATGEAKTLAEGQVVCVFGPWDATTQTVTATVIVVLDTPAIGPQPAHVRGKVLLVDADTRSFTVEAINAYMGFRPQSRGVKVHTDASTRFGFVPPAPATFDDVTPGAVVDVLGSWDASSAAIKARRVLILQNPRAF